MHLTQLLANYQLSQEAQEQIDLYSNCSFSECVDDSRKLGAGDLFLAFPGASSDGRDYFAEAIAAKVAAIIYQAPTQSELVSKQDYFTDSAKQCAGLGIAFIALDDLAAEAGAIAARFYDNPGSKLTVIGITGTNGKTSVATWVAESLSALGKRCAIMGTLGVGFPGDIATTGLTTTGAVATQKHLFDLYFSRFLDLSIVVLFTMKK